MFAVESRMSVEETQAVMDAYLHDLLHEGPYARHFADDMILSVMWTDQVAHGAEEAKGMIDLMHKQAFAATPILTTLWVGPGNACAELVFVAKHIGEFAKIAATGKGVNVPYCAVYDLAHGKITALRLYLPMQELLRQLGFE